MNDHSAENFDARQIDRLVDGELSSDERQALLLRLESDPAGWRRCALAFLEAQSWRSGFGELLASTTPAEPTSLTPAKSAPALAKRPWQPTTFFAVAASFLLAFTLGLVVRRAPLPTASTLATAPTIPQNASEGAAATFDFDRGLAASSQTPRVMLKLAGADDSASREVPLPVLAPDELSRQWRSTFPAELPADLLRQLGRLGHRVERVRDLVPVRLDDGTPAEVPMEGYQIHYVGDRYQ